MSGPDAVHLEETPQGTRLKLRVVPGASRDRVVGVLGDALKICVSAAAEKGKANKRIVAMLAACLGVASRDVQVVAGETSRDKRVLVVGLSTTELRNRLTTVLRPDV
jgi:uncharacterized protein (TIGR00251 family)